MDVPAENRFIAALDPEDAAALRPLLRRAQLRLEQVVIEQDGPVREVHFPIDAQFANLIRFTDGSTVETAVIGFEGLTGLAPFMADRPCGWEVGCRAPGAAWVAEATALRTLAEDRPELMRRLHDLTDFYQAQAAQTAACNARHPVPARVARWLLTARDLSPVDTLRFRQEELARLVGARRSTVSEAATLLRRRKLIAYARGAIRIVDREGLEAAACECHAILRQRLETVVGPTP